MRNQAAIMPIDRMIAVETIIHVIECANCNIDFGIGDDFMQRRREDHDTFYCPNGHCNYYPGKTDREKELDRVKTQLGYAVARATAAEDQAETAERRRRAEKGAKTKLQRRIAAGVCPACHRTFKELARHMAGQHPDYCEDDHGDNS